MNLEPSHVALSIVNHISAVVAYWDSNQRCVFSNDAYREWFGIGPEQLLGMSLKELLGPMYEVYLPYILAALRGEKQVFERQFRLPGGEVRESIVTYTPDIIDGLVHGFSVHVADVTMVREREAALERALRERDDALADVQTLRGLLPICANCKHIRDASGAWQPIEQYVMERTEAIFSHGICPACMVQLYPEYSITSDNPEADMV